MYCMYVCMYVYTPIKVVQHGVQNEVVEGEKDGSINVKPVFQTFLGQ